MRRGRNAKACITCRTTKTRCSYSQDPETCDKCLTKGIICVSYAGQLGSVQRPQQTKVESPSANGMMALPTSYENGYNEYESKPSVQKRPPQPPREDQQFYSQSEEERLKRLEANVSEILGAINQAQPRQSECGGQLPTSVYPSPQVTSSHDHHQNLHHPQPPLPPMMPYLGHIQPSTSGSIPPGLHSALPSGIPAAVPSGIHSIPAPFHHHMGVYPPPSGLTGVLNIPRRVSNSTSTGGVATPPNSTGAIATPPSSATTPPSVSSSYPLVHRSVPSHSKEMDNSSQWFQYRESLSCAALSSIRSPAGFGEYSRLFQAARGKPSAIRRGPTLLDAGVLPHGQILGLFQNFRDNYNHWISLPDEVDTPVTVERLLRHCPILVTSCCAVAIRFWPADMWAAVYPAVIRHLWVELQSSMLDTPQCTEYIQSLTVISQFADSLSYEECIFDQWFVSSVGLQHLETMASTSGPFSHVTLRLYNHLFLAHVAASNFTGRKSLVESDSGLATARRVLESPLSTTFDSCMVAELEMQSLAQGFFRFKISLGEFDFQAARWWDKWRHLTQKPLIQFIEPVYLYTRFTVKVVAAFRDQATDKNDWHGGTAKVTEPLAETALRTTSIPNLSNDLAAMSKVMEALLEVVQESFFPCLSDELLQMGFNACIMALVIVRLWRERSPGLDILPTTAAAFFAQHLAARFAKSSRRPGDLSWQRSCAVTELLPPL